MSNTVVNTVEATRVMRNSINQENNIMSFVNEYIPASDFSKYGFEELNKRQRKGGFTASDWTIDRAADIWIRQFYMESDHTESDGGFTGVSGWDFYWKGNLMFVEVKTLSSGRQDDGSRWRRVSITGINIPEHLRSRSTEIVDDLETAFTAYKGAGVFSDNAAGNYTFVIENKEDLA